MKVLIQTVAGDGDAAAVATVLDLLGVETRFSIGTDVPTIQCLSVQVDENRSEASIRRAGRIEVFDDSFDAIWCRRIKAFRLPQLHADDVEYAKLTMLRRLAVNFRSGRLGT